VLFFATARSPDEDAILVLSPSLRDLGVKMNDVQRFTPFTIRMLSPSVARGVIAKVQAASTIETKSDSERHGNTSPIAVRTASPVDCLRKQFVDRIGDGHLPHADKGPKAVHRDRQLIFDSVTVLDVFLFPFFVQVGPCGHTTSHDHPHFSSIDDRVKSELGGSLTGRWSGTMALLLVST
jgi:hypothetical protein